MPSSGGSVDVEYVLRRCRFFPHEFTHQQHRADVLVRCTTIPLACSLIQQLEDGEHT